MRADVARQVEKLVGGEIGRRHAVQHLLIGRVGRLGRAPVLADQRLDRRAVDHVERIERSGAVVARIDRRRVDDQQVLEQHAQPVAERAAPVGPGEERERRVDAGGGVRQVRARALAHGEVLRRDLVLARLDDGAQQRQRVGERAQFGEGDAALGARDIVEVGAERIVELPPLHLRRGLRRERLLRPEPGVRRDAGDGVARGLGEAGEDVRGQRAFERRPDMQGSL